MAALIIQTRNCSGKLQFSSPGHRMTWGVESLLWVMKELVRKGPEFTDRASGHESVHHKNGCLRFSANLELFQTFLQLFDTKTHFFLFLRACNLTTTSSQIFWHVALQDWTDITRENSISFATLRLVTDHPSTPCIHDRNQTWSHSPAMTPTPR